MRCSSHTCRSSSKKPAARTRNERGVAAGRCTRQPREVALRPRLERGPHERQPHKVALRILPVRFVLHPELGVLQPATGTHLSQYTNAAALESAARDPSTAAGTASDGQAPLVDIAASDGSVSIAAAEAETQELDAAKGRLTMTYSAVARWICGLPDRSSGGADMSEAPPFLHQARRRSLPRGILAIIRRTTHATCQ